MLHENFTQIISQHTADNHCADKYWVEITNAYQQKGRHYHNLTHLENMYAELLLVKDAVGRWDILVLALCYHDLVYNPLKSNNEAQSAVIAIDRLQEIGLNEQDIHLCNEMILATQGHSISDDGDINYFTDADLSVLGADSAIYKAYAKAIRKEYSVYPDLLYNPGRRKVLKHFLAMDSIFKTDFFKEKFEENARRNLFEELNSI